VSKEFRFEDLARVSDFRQNIAKLRVGRIDLISYSEESLLDFINANHLNAKDFITAFVLQEIGSYYAFNRQTPDDVIQQFQAALDSLKTERQQLLEKYRFIK
jgi:polar amino acid transport system substrate-binding protein